MRLGRLARQAKAQHTQHSHLTMPPTKQASPCTKLPSLSEMASCASRLQGDQSGHGHAWQLGPVEGRLLACAMQVKPPSWQARKVHRQACLVGVGVLTQRVQQVGGGGAGVKEGHVLRGGSGQWGCVGAASWTCKPAGCGALAAPGCERWLPHLESTQPHLGEQRGKVQASHAVGLGRPRPDEAGKLQRACRQAGWWARHGGSKGEGTGRHGMAPVARAEQCRCTAAAPPPT